MHLSCASPQELPVVCSCARGLILAPQMKRCLEWKSTRALLEHGQQWPSELHPGDCVACCPTKRLSGASCPEATWGSLERAGSKSSTSLGPCSFQGGAALSQRGKAPTQRSLIEAELPSTGTHRVRCPDGHVGSRCGLGASAVRLALEEDVVRLLTPLISTTSTTAVGCVALPQNPLGAGEGEAERASGDLLGAEPGRAYPERTPFTPAPLWPSAGSVLSGSGS